MAGSDEDLEPMGLDWQGVEGTEEDPWLLVSDGGLSGSRGGIGIVLARRKMIVEARGYGLRVHKGDSTELEWLGKAVLLRTTCHLKGKKVLVADSAAGAFRGSKIPKWGTWLEAYARGALDKVDLGTYVEGWV